MSLSDEIVEDAQHLLALQIATGFYTREWIIENAVEYYSEEADEHELKKAIPKLFDAAMAERRQEMLSWPEATDCERLDAAFDELNAAGIMARHSWWCCGNCGQDAMIDEFERVANEGHLANPRAESPRGYVFYHQQDTERVAEAAISDDGEGAEESMLLLSYGSTRDGDDEEKASVAIGKEVARILNKHGLKTHWDGTIEHRIGVHMDWKRREKPLRWCEGVACGE